MLKIEGGGEWLSAPATLPEVEIKPVEEKQKKNCINLLSNVMNHLVQ